MKKHLNLIKTKYFLPILLLILGVILLAVPTKKTENSTTDTNTDISFYTSEIENKLTDLLLKIEGIENVSIMITLENNGEQVLAENKANSSTEYVIISNGNSDKGIILTEIFPSVRGVAVVCTNGNDSAVREKITSLVSAALGIPTNRITVVG